MANELSTQTSARLGAGASVESNRGAHLLMALIAVGGMAAIAFQIFVPGEKATYGLFAAAVGTIAVIVTSLRKRRPASSAPWSMIGLGIGLVSVGAVAERIIAPQLATRPELYLASSSRPSPRTSRPPP